MQEEWKPIEGYEGYYEISSFGRVKSLSRTIYTVWKNGEPGTYFQEGRILTTKECAKNKNGWQTYLQVCLSVDGVQKYKMIHRLVAEAFLEHPVGKDYVNHKDGNKHNNRIDNLEWVTQKENIEHCIKAFDTKVVTPVVCVETGERFSSTRGAAKSVGVSHSSISMAINGIRKTAGGLHWELAGKQRKLKRWSKNG